MSTEVPVSSLVERLGPEGIPGFRWAAPVPLLRSVSEDTIPAVAAVSRRYADETGPGEAMMLICHFAVQEFLSLVQAHLLAASNDPVPVRESSRLWRAAARGERPPPSPYIDYLKAGLPNAPLWRRAARPLATLWNRSAFSYRWPTPALLRSTTVTITAGPLEAHHAGSLDDPVVYAPVHGWFDRLDERDFTATRDRVRKSAAAADLVDAALEAGRAHGIALSSNLQGYLFDHITDMAGAMLGHLERLRTRPERLPRTLWTGTGGILWSRTLRHAVRGNGGTVTGHDHAEGHGHFSTDLRPFYEFPASDRFATFNDAQVHALEERSDPRLLADGCKPQVLNPMRTSDPLNPEQDLDALPSEPKSIMYVATLYHEERVLSHPVMQYLVAIDWQMRLLTALKSWGYEVIFKPHPGSKVAPPQAVLDICDRTITAPFESVIDQADLFLFDVPQTTTFGSLLRTSSKPVVVIDVGMDRWDPDAKLAVERRCALVGAHFDDDGRIQIGWDELKNAITSSVGRTDPSFARTYLTYGS